jgi:endonuclease III
MIGVDAAITEALDAELANRSDQTDDFQRRFRTLIELVLTGNYQDADVRRVMEMLKVKIEAED